MNQGETENVGYWLEYKSGSPFVSRIFLICIMNILFMSLVSNTALHLINVGTFQMMEITNNWIWAGIKSAKWMSNVISHTMKRGCLCKAQHKYFRTWLLLVWECEFYDFRVHAILLFSFKLEPVWHGPECEKVVVTGATLHCFGTHPLLPNLTASRYTQ